MILDLVGILMKSKLCECGGKHYAKGLCSKCYYQTPEYKARAKTRQQTPEHKAKAKAYSQRPEVKARAKAYNQTPEAKAKAKAYNQRPEVKARTKIRHQTIEYKAKEKAYNQTPERKAWKKIYQRTSKYKTNTNKQRKNKYYNNPVYNLIKKIRARVRIFIKTKNYKKNNMTMQIVGCTPQELRNHIEKQFTFGMSWELILNGKIEIHHINFLSNAKTEKDVYRLCHYSNLKPLWVEEHRAIHVNMREPNVV